MQGADRESEKVVSLVLVLLRHHAACCWVKSGHNRVACRRQTVDIQSALKRLIITDAGDPSGLTSGLWQPLLLLPLFPAFAAPIVCGR
jgi:hypothetical protein